MVQELERKELENMKLVSADRLTVEQRVNVITPICLSTSMSMSALSRNEMLLIPVALVNSSNGVALHLYINVNIKRLVHRFHQPTRFITVIEVLNKYKDPAHTT